MKQTLFLTALITAFLLASCSKEKKVEKMLYGEWEVTSFMHGANDLTQLYKDSCGCRLMFSDTKLNCCYVYCPHNGWNYYILDSLSVMPWKNHQFNWTYWEISRDGRSIEWGLGNIQPDSVYRWGMYPLATGNKLNSFYVNEISDKSMQLQFTDSTNIPFNISFTKNK